MEQTALIVHHYLLYFILPVWIVAGLADYAMHRASHIALTSGTKESFFHLLMLVEVGVPLLAGLFFEINALVILMMLVALVLHQATAMWDVHYAYNSAREVKPLEQHVHSLLEVLPVMAFSFVIILHWPQFLSLFGRGAEPPEFSLVFKTQYWPSSYTAALLVAVFFLSLVPYGEEFIRCIRAAGRGRGG